MGASVAKKIKRELEMYGLLNEPFGVDIIEMPVLAALQAAGITVVDGQQVFLEARRIKTPDEIGLLTHACSMVDTAARSSPSSPPRNCSWPGNGITRSQGR
jgi:Xaa-Pro aminopeptidase